MTDQAPISPLIKPGTLSNPDAVFLFVSFGIGASMVAGSLIVYYMGLVLALLVFAIGTVMSIQASYMYSRLVIQTGDIFPEDAALTAGGRKFQRLTNVIQAILVMGESIFIIYIGATSLSGALVQIFKPQEPVFWMSKNMCLVYIAFMIGYFAFAKEVKQMKCAAYLMFALIIIFMICLVIYGSMNHISIRLQNSSFKFIIPLWPQYPAVPVLSKISIIYVATAYQVCSMPVILSMKNLTLKNSATSATVAIFIILILFLFVSIIPLFIFGELVTTRDIVTRVLSAYSRTWISLIIQVLFSFLSIFHVPVYVFSGRQSLLQFLHSYFKFARLQPVPSQEDGEGTALVQQQQSDKGKIMYQRVPRWLFYVCAALNFLFMLLVTGFVSNVLPVLQIFVSPGFTYTCFAFPNICLILLKGWRKQKTALVFLIIDLIFCIFTLVISIVNLQI